MLQLFLLSESKENLHNFNPLIPENDKLLISPDKITLESNIKGHKNKGNDHNLKICVQQ